MGHAGGVGQQPGSGGVSRGRADAEMLWGEETAGRTDQFEAKVLPRAAYEDSEHSLLLGVGSTQPEVDAKGEAGGLTNVEASTGKTAWRRRLSPKHRRAVGTFFSQRTSSDN